MRNKILNYIQKDFFLCMSIKNIKICHLTYKTVCSITFFPLSLEMQIIQFFLNYKQT